MTTVTIDENPPARRNTRLRPVPPAPPGAHRSALVPPVRPGRHRSARTDRRRRARRRPSPPVRRDPRVLTERDGRGRARPVASTAWSAGDPRSDGRAGPQGPAGDPQATGKVNYAGETS